MMQKAAYRCGNAEVEGLIVIPESLVAWRAPAEEEA
jgi:hypothetical protein